MNRVKVTITLRLEAKNPAHAEIAIAEVIKLLAPDQSTQIAKDLVKAVDVQLSEAIPTEESSSVLVDYDDPDQCPSCGHVNTFREAVESRVCEICDYEW